LAASGPEDRARLRPEPEGQQSNREGLGDKRPTEQE